MEGPHGGRRGPEDQRARQDLGRQDFTNYEGGIYSSEWFWAKALKLVRNGSKAVKAASTIVEHCDWMPALLTGTDDISKLKRSRCAAGHKAMWHASWGGYPPAAFLDKLDPRLSALAASLGTETYTAETVIGRLCEEWGRRLGLSTEIVVSVGAFDAHIGAVGGDVAPGTLLKIMGTSTCDIMIGQSPSASALGAPKDKSFGDNTRRYWREARARDLRPGRRLRSPRHDRLRGGAVGVRRRLRLVPEAVGVAGARGGGPDRQRRRPRGFGQ